MNYIVFDVETANPIVDWRDHQALGVSWAVTYESRTDSYQHYRAQHGLGPLAATLAGAELLVSWNGAAFDLPLLEATMRKLNMPMPTIEAPHCDLFALIEQATGTKIGLSEAAKFTLGEDKTGTGDQAPALARADKWDELASYCQNDVRLTRDLYEFVARYGYILTEDGRLPLCVPGGVRASTPEPTPATTKQVEYIMHLRYVLGERDPLGSLTKGQARREIERLQRMREAP